MAPLDLPFILRLATAVGSGVIQINSSICAVDWSRRLGKNLPPPKATLSTHLLALKPVPAYPWRGALRESFPNSFLFVTTTTISG